MKKPLCLLIILLTTASLFADRGIRVRENLENRSGKSIGTYRALVIGINDYKDSAIPDLETAVNDAKSIAALLKGTYGFTDLKLLLDSQADGSSIQKELRKLVTKSKKSDSILIYYAGHGDLDKLTGDGWWIPHNAKAGDPFTYLENYTIQKYVRAVPARHVLLVADSCFSGTLFGKARALPAVIDDKYYASLFKEKSRWGMTSGNLTPVTDRGAGGHSLFAYQFIKSLKENQNPYITPREIYQQIAPVISNNSEQTPITKPIRNSDDRGGEFIFIREKTTGIEQAKVTPSINAEEEFWNTVKNSSFIEDIQAYLTDYPNGRFARIAKIKIRQLQRKQKPVEVAGGSVQTEETGAGTINIGSQPSGAKIYIDNSYQGTSPLSLQLKPGQHTVKATKPGYKPEKKTVQIRSNKRLQLSLILDKLGGSIWIRSNPESAKIYLNDVYYGETPDTLKGLKGGNYQITLKKDGYKDWRQSQYVSEGQEANINGQLKKKSSAPEEMVLIPAGEFKMGSNSGDKDEKPVHRVYLDAFSIDKTEVTVADYKKCVSSGRCEVANSNYWSGKHQSKYDKYCNYDKNGRGDHPINCVDWKNAKTYCQFVNKRLSTEAEWEKAATWKNGQKYKYPSGKNSVSCNDAVMSDGGAGCGKTRTWPAGSKTEEINGTHDMAGNVWEWVSDWYGNYSSGSQRNPKGSSSGSGRVRRGGGWSDDASYLRGAFRNNYGPSGRNNSIGFRCAVSP